MEKRRCKERKGALPQLYNKVPQVAPVVKNPLGNAGDIRDAASVPASRSPGGGHGYPLQHSCLGNPMDRGAWWAIVHTVAKSWTGLKRLSTQNKWKAGLGPRPQTQASTPRSLRWSNVTHVGALVLG